ncbi:MAG: DUF962 domain-containing protein [Alphaproteobacteria bacterium]|nr:DUF962 domain-containing protein [Alphaproteobacteria bacterium]
MAGDLRWRMVRVNRRHTIATDFPVDKSLWHDDLGQPSERQMKTLADQMAIYAAYHRNARNRATHFVGVPAIAFAILIPMGWVAHDVAGIPVSLALVFTIVILAYYAILDRFIGAITVLVLAPIFVAAQWVALLEESVGLVVFAIAFVGGWIVQLIGHMFEGRRPALVDNLFQVLIAPIFLVAEVLFALGLKRGLAADVAGQMPRHLPTAGSRTNAVRGVGD